MTGPLSYEDVNGDHTLSGYDSDVVLRYNASGQLIVPNDADGNFPRGMQVAVESFSGTVRIVGADGVEIKGADRLAVGPLRTGVMVKENANFWLLSLGSSGGGGGSSPSAPKNAAAYGRPDGVLITWDLPEDDGGHSITSYTVEWGTSADKLTNTINVAADKLYALIDNLTAGTTYYAWVKASNSVGTSDPTSVVSATPAQGYNQATGGTEGLVTLGGKTYKTHTFTGNNTFSVKKASAPFRVLVVAGGANGGHGNAYYSVGGVGGNGEAIDKYLTLEVKDYPVVTGTAAAASSIAGVSAEPGTNGGDAYNDGGTFRNGADGKMHTRIASDITGTSVTYSAGNGSTGGGGQPGNPGSTPGGGGGGGGGATNDLKPAREGGAGQGGIVVVSYEMAPFNDITSTSGSYKDVANYNGTTETWRVWTFNAGNAKITVNNAIDKFRVLCVAGGGGGAGRAGNNAQGAVGGSGGAGGAREWQYAVLETKTYDVVIGGPGGGGDGGGQPTQGGDGGNTQITGTDYITHGGGGGGIGNPGRNGGSGGGGGSAIGNWGGPWGGGSGMSGEGASGTGGGPQGSGGSGGHIDLKSDITGASVSYSNGAYGNGGGGAGWDSPGGPGAPGVLIIAYRIK